MSELYEGIFSELVSDSAIATKTSYTGGKYHVYPFNVPEGQISSGTAGSRYFITYNKITETKVTDIDYELSIYQITAIADTYENAIALKNDIIRVFNRYYGNLQGKRTVKNVTYNTDNELKDPDTNYYYIPIDFTFRFIGDNQ